MYYIGVERKGTYRKGIVMSYRYHVEFTKEFGNISSSFVFKYEQFSEAFERFVFETNNSLDKSFSWSVVLYDVDLCDIKCRVDSTDFE